MEEEIYLHSNFGEQSTRPIVHRTAWDTFFDQRQVVLKAGEIITVNCNRIDHYEKQLEIFFLKHYQEACTQLYLMTSCPYQRPLSLAKRLVWGMKDNNKMSMTYIKEIRKADTHDPFHEYTITINPTRSEEETWNNLWNDLQRGLNNAKGTESPKQYAAFCPAEFVVLLFKVEKIQEYALDYLEYIIDQFAHASLERCKFLLFFSFEFPEIEKNRYHEHENSWKKVLYLNDRLEKKWPDTMRITRTVEFLKAVKTTCIEDWTNMCLTPSDKLKKNLFKSIIQEFRRIHSDNTDEFDMEHVEAMQAAAWKCGEKSENYHF